MKLKNLIIILILLLMILIVLITVVNFLTKEQETNGGLSITNTEKTPTTIKEVIEKSESVYIKETGDIVLNIYVDFKYDLYDKNGESNKIFFDQIIDNIIELRQENFCLIDEEKDINIQVIFSSNGTCTIKINGEEDYYRKINGDTYFKLQEASRPEEEKMTVQSMELSDIINGGMGYTRAGLGEGTDLNNGYTLYKNATIKTRNDKGIAKNIVFLSGYEPPVIKDIKVGTPLKEINETYKQVAFGSIRDGYLGYILEDVYIFFYEDEISVYGYSYRQSVTFEEDLEEYLKNKDLEKFAESVIFNWSRLYDLYEYDDVRQNAYITVPLLGVKIDIRNNNPSGITLYSNYYFTEKTKRWVKDGLITVNPEDYIHIIEKDRRNTK